MGIQNRYNKGVLFNPNKSNLELQEKSRNDCEKVTSVSLEPNNKISTNQNSRSRILTRISKADAAKNRRRAEVRALNEQKSE